MSFNRLNYDNCAYAKTLQESTSPLEYNLFMGKYENKKQCPEGKFTNNLPFVILIVSIIDAKLFSIQ